MSLTPAAAITARQAIIISAKEFAGSPANGTEQTADLAALTTYISTLTSPVFGVELVFPSGDDRTAPLVINANNITINGDGARITSTNGSGSA